MHPPKRKGASAYQNLQSRKQRRNQTQIPAFVLIVWITFRIPAHSVRSVNISTIFLWSVNGGFCKAAIFFIIPLLTTYPHNLISKIDLPMIQIHVIEISGKCLFGGVHIQTNNLAYQFPQRLVLILPHIVPSGSGLVPQDFFQSFHILFCQGLVGVKLINGLPCCP